MHVVLEGAPHVWQVDVLVQRPGWAAAFCFAIVVVRAAAGERGRRHACCSFLSVLERMHSHFAR